MLNLDEPFRNQDNFTITLFTLVQIWVLRVTFFLQFLVDPHIFADLDLDPGCQNLADPTDPDPKHWKNMSK